MDLNKENVSYIKDKFNGMADKSDFLSLLNYVKKLIYSDNFFAFEPKNINFFITNQSLKDRYFQFSVKKKNGGTRIINAPTDGLKAIQRCLNVIFQIVYDVNPAATGFIPGKSILDNANVHSGNLYVYNLDLKDFFHSIDQARLWGRLKHPPFNLNEKTGRIEIANIISMLCCYKISVLEPTGEYKNKSVLPQGAPTSPVITNIICQQLDFYLSACAKRFKLKYSRYADDITFSSMHNVYQDGSSFRKEVQRIIVAQNFTIQENKTRLQRQAFRQEVTGLVVNVKPNVQKRYIKEIRMWLYYWETYGYDKANHFFSLKNANDTTKDRPVSGMLNVLAGKLDYLKMVKGSNNPMYNKLKDNFKQLATESNLMNNILDIWEQEGIEKAMEKFYESHSAIVYEKV